MANELRDPAGRPGVIVEEFERGRDHFRVRNDRVEQTNVRKNRRHVLAAAFGEQEGGGSTGSCTPGALRHLQRARLRPLHRIREHRRLSADLLRANLFAFPGLARLHFGTEYYAAALNGWLHFQGGAQTVVGVALVFFLGLGLRNRFRLK